MPKRTEELKPSELRGWRFIEEFRQRLDSATVVHAPEATFADRRRRLQYADYLSLFLFGLLNPTVRTMRALCAASHFDRVQEEVCGRPVSLGSFSETQHLMDPSLLAEVFGQLSREVAQRQGGSPLAGRDWWIQDSSLWEALPRMHWAVWRTQGRRQQAVRLHLSLRVADSCPRQASVTAGRRCERAEWRAQWEAGACYVGDRYYGENYALLGELTRRGCGYVLRLREEAALEVLEELALTAEDRAAQVLRQGWVRLGTRASSEQPRVRVVWVQGPQEVLVLVTNQAVAELSAQMVALVYRHRWRVELFFRWIKCILGNRHWLAESMPGVALQVYLALIAAVLLQLVTGQRPTKRIMEAIQLHLQGWATQEELQRVIAKELARCQAKKT